MTAHDDDRSKDRTEPEPGPNLELDRTDDGLTGERPAPQCPPSATTGLEAKLWAAADALRNNMDAAEYLPAPAANLRRTDGVEAPGPQGLPGLCRWPASLTGNDKV